MTNQQSKKLTPELIIIAAVLIGLWSMVIAPMRTNLCRAQAVHANAIEHMRIVGDPELSTPRLGMVRDALENAIGDVEMRSSVARDQTALQARLMEIGAETRVQINRVSPAKAKSITKNGANDLVVSFEIECSGLYRDITAFLAEIESNVGLTRIDRISIRPDPSASGAAVRARFSTMHYAFDTTPLPSDDAVDGLVEGAH